MHSNAEVYRRLQNSHLCISRCRYFRLRTAVGRRHHRGFRLSTEKRRTGLSGLGAVGGSSEQSDPKFLPSAAMLPPEKPISTKTSFPWKRGTVEQPVGAPVFDPTDERGEERSDASTAQATAPLLDSTTTGKREVAVLVRDQAAQVLPGRQPKRAKEAAQGPAQRPTHTVEAQSH